MIFYKLCVKRFKLTVYTREKCLKINTVFYRSERPLSLDFKATLTSLSVNCQKNSQSVTESHWCKKGSEAMGSPPIKKCGPQPSCQMLKMGSSGSRSGPTLGVYALGGGLKRWLRSGRREARCNKVPEDDHLCSGWPGMSGCPSISRTSSREITGGNLCDPIVALSFPLKDSLNYQHLNELSVVRDNNQVRFSKPAELKEHYVVFIP